MRNGKTVEVDNTDAEGRLVLADALTYAETFRPDVIVDFATLTGAVLVALGSECAGVMTPDERLARELADAGEAVGERLWRLPVWDEYLDNLKSEWADMRNTGGRNAGTINGAIFLKQFAPKGIPWAHIDFAARGAHGEGTGGLPGGRHRLRSRADGRVSEAPLRRLKRLAAHFLAGGGLGIAATGIDLAPFFPTLRTAKNRLSVETPASADSPADGAKS